MLLVKTLKCMFLIKNLRVYNIGKLSAAFSLSGPLCGTFPYNYQIKPHLELSSI